MRLPWGKVLSKNIIRKQEHVKGGVRNSYYLVFEINNNDYKIGIFYATKKEVKNDSVINLVDIGKTYTFYMDPTYFKDDNLKNGIDIIEYNGLEIYKASLKPNLYGGLSMCIIGFILFFVTRRIRKKIIEERISSLSC